MSIDQHKALFTRIRVADANSKRYVELRSQAVDALRSLLEAHQTLEDALDTAEVVIDEINAIEFREPVNGEAA